MAQVTDTWTVAVVAGNPLDASAMVSYLDAIEASVNDINNSQINAAAGIDGAKLADNSITTAKYKDLSVTTAKLADVNVTTAKIAAANITDALMSWTSVRAARTPHAAGYKMLWGQLSAAAAAAATQDFAITFATHSTPITGATAFSSATNLQVTAVIQGPNAGDILCCFQKGAATASTVTFTVHRADGGLLNAGGTPIILHWIAIGQA